MPKKNNIAKTDSNHIYSKKLIRKNTQNHVNLRWNKKKAKNRKRKENKADLKSSSSKSNRTYLDLIIRHNPIFVLISYLTRLYVLETKFHVLDNRISKAYLWNQKIKHNLKKHFATTIHAIKCTTLHETVQCTIMYVTYGFPKNELSLWPTLHTKAYIHKNTKKLSLKLIALCRSSKHFTILFTLLNHL